MSPETLRPWVSLLTWEFLAFLGGIAFLPAIYIFVFRLASAKFAGAEFSMKEVVQIEEDAEEAAEDASPQEAAEALQSDATEIPDDLKGRFEAAFTTWQNLRIVVKSRAHLVGGPENLKSVKRNIRSLAVKFPDKVSSEDVRKAEQLDDDLKNFKASPKTLTKSALRSFRNRAGRLSRKIESIPVEIAEIAQE